MKSTYKGVIKELGNSSVNDGNSIKEYRYIEFKDGQIITKVRIGTSMDRKLHSALSSGGVTQLELFNDLIIGLILGSGEAYINRSLPIASSALHKFLGWLGIVIGILLIPVLFMGLIVIAYSIKILHNAKLFESQEKLIVAQQGLISQYPKAIIFSDY